MEQSEGRGEGDTDEAAPSAAATPGTGATSAGVKYKTKTIGGNKRVKKRRVRQFVDQAHSGDTAAAPAAVAATSTASAVVPTPEAVADGSKDTKARENRPASGKGRVKRKRGVGGNEDGPIPNVSPDVQARFGELVWAKQRGYPAWPAYIYDPREISPRLQKVFKIMKYAYGKPDYSSFCKRHFVVYYYGYPQAQAYAKCEGRELTPYDVGFERGLHTPPSSGPGAVKAKERPMFEVGLKVIRAEHERARCDRVAWNHFMERSGAKGNGQLRVLRGNAWMDARQLGVNDDGSMRVRYPDEGRFGIVDESLSVIFVDLDNL